MPFNPTYQPDLGQTTYAQFGNEGFTPNGIIAPWYSGLFFSFMTQAEPATYKPSLVEKPEGSEWATVFFKEHAQALTAAKADGQKFGPNHVWRLTSMVSDALNIDPEKWSRSPAVSYAIPMTGTDSKYRHVFHLMALPSVISAAAIIAGFKAEELPKNPLTALMGKQVVFDENLERQMIGDPVAKAGEDGYWGDSELGQWRKQLWAILGEHDPLKYSANSTSGPKVLTTAPALVYCLQFAAVAMTNPMWARVVPVPDPLLKSTYTNRKTNEVKRNTFGVIWELFTSAAEAKQVADQENEERAARTSETVVADASNEPLMPGAWAGVEQESIAELTRMVETGSTLFEIAKQLNVTPKDVAAWKAYLNL